MSKPMDNLHDLSAVGRALRSIQHIVPTGGSARTGGSFGRWMLRIRQGLSPRWTALLGIAVTIGFLVLLAHWLREINLAAVAETVARTPWTIIALSLFLSAISYITLIGYDAYAARLAAPDKPMPPAKLALGAFTSYAIGHTLGFPVVTANAVRWRIYSAAGLTPMDVGKLAALAGLTLWLGMAAVIGSGLVFEPDAVAGLDHLSPPANVAIGAASLALLSGFILWCGTAERSVGWRDAHVGLPGAGPLIIQIGLGVIDVSAAAAAFWVYLPAGSSVGFVAFAPLFAVAIAGAILSHAPAGLGAFEAAMIFALPNIPVEDVLSAAVLWRITYSLVPFVVAVALLSAYEVLRPGSRLARWLRIARRIARAVAPQLLGALTFAGGLVLLISGATPSDEARIRALKHLLPLPFIELSHLIGSAAGVMLLIVARGLTQRLESAWTAAVAILGTGMAVSLAKGFDWEETLVLGAVLGALVLYRSSFYRKAGLLAAPLSPNWLLGILAVVAASIWLGFLDYTNVDYSNHLWWSFAWNGDASRFLRASVAAAVTAVGVSSYMLVHQKPQPRKADSVPSRTLGPIVAHAVRADANLAFLGDKRFLVHEAEDAFIMYGVRGRTWIAMGDPVGNPARARDLLWRFLEVADAHAGWPVLYQVSPGLLPLYLDAGLSLVKLGEEAKVDLSTFTLEGSAGREWRHTLNRAARDGLTFSIIPAAEVGRHLVELKAVSDAWLATKAAGEKGFSIGFWSEGYISLFDIAAVWQRGEIVAFANIWYGRPGGEITVDLMRHRPGAPRVMDVLFINLMLEGKARGFRWFNLGMAPLSGLSDHPLAPSWHKIAGGIARASERLYGFGGLRAYKEKFNPVWEARYLAYPGGWTLPQILLDTTTLISRGAVKAISK